ncbi:MAG TPA: heavy metal-associated domain-containing protein [Bacteroidia bacterium]|jgi:copper chaperone CopZ
MIMFFAYAENVGVRAGQSRETVKIKTSAQCETCKANIEKALSFTKGVKSANLDVDTKVVTVEYDPSKTTIDKIRIAISKAGYDADDVKADPKAYSKLKECCKKPEEKK